MKQSSIIVLQTVVVLFGIAALAFMLWEPHIEGRNAHATLFEIYFKDPLLAYAYIASIPFFMALFQAFKVLGYAGHNKEFSQDAMIALRKIKRFAVILIGFTVVGEIFLLLNDSDDRAGGFFIGFLVILGSLVIAAAAVRFERMLQNGMNDTSG